MPQLATSSEDKAKLPAPRAVLVVDDDERFRSRLAAALLDRSVQVSVAGTREEAVERCQSQPFWGIVTDLRMPRVNGLELVSELRERCPAARLVVLTGYGSIASAVQAIRLGATDYLVKPCNADQILAALEKNEQRQSEQTLSEVTPSLARLEHEHIERVLFECGNNVSKAARVLGIHRRTLQYKLAKYPSAR
jgi:two-component system response regulator RegA